MKNKQVYKVGDLAQGGIIFYVNETGDHGLATTIHPLVYGHRKYDEATEYINDPDTQENKQYIEHPEGERPTDTQDSMLTVVHDFVNNSNNHDDHQGKLYSDWRLPTEAEFFQMANNLNGYIDMSKEDPVGFVGNDGVSNTPYLVSDKDVIYSRLSSHAFGHRPEHEANEPYIHDAASDYARKGSEFVVGLVAMVRPVRAF